MDLVDSLAFSLEQGRIIAYMLDERNEFETRINVLKKRMVLWAAQRGNLMRQAEEWKGKFQAQSLVRSELEQGAVRDSETIRLLEGEVRSANRRSLWTGIKSFLGGAAVATLVYGAVNTTR